MSLDDDATDRYCRQIILPEIGPQGQERLLGSAVLVHGCGALGTTTIEYLSAAGVGCVDIVRSTDTALPEEQRADLHDINPEIVHQEHTLAFLAAGTENGGSLKYDVLVETTGRADALAILSRLAVLYRIPLLSGCVHGTVGRFCVRRGASAALPPTGNVTGTVHHSPAANHPQQAAVAGVIGSLQALAVIALLLGLDSPPPGTFVAYDALSGSVSSGHLDRVYGSPRNSGTGVDA